MATAARAGVFVVAAAIGAFDLGSYFYLRWHSVDFVVARRVADAPAYALGTKVSCGFSLPALYSAGRGPARRVRGARRLPRRSS